VLIKSSLGGVGSGGSGGPGLFCEEEPPPHATIEVLNMRNNKTRYFIDLSSLI
jgi:hypothetical protein